MIQACLYAVTVCSVMADGDEWTLTGVQSGRSEAEAVGAAVIEWEKNRKVGEKLTHVNWDSADYDQLAYIAAQCEAGDD